MALPERASRDVKGASRLDGYGQLRKAAAAAGALLSRLWPRRATIHVADVSDEWIADHQNETPKHAQDL